jgi:pimeloyl-ACP methyl ester carboxylesterase
LVQARLPYGRTEGNRCRRRNRDGDSGDRTFIVALCDALELDEPIFMGSSFGGNVAL